MRNRADYRGREAARSRGLTIELDESVLAGLQDVIARPEFGTIAVVEGQARLVPLYNSPADFLARRVIKEGLMPVAGMIPSVAALNEAIEQNRQQIETLLTPAIVAGV